jgi:predicted SprT family Zn-dependent metalloprotease
MFCFAHLFSQGTMTINNEKQNKNSDEVLKPEILRESIISHAPLHYKSKAYQKMTLAYASNSAYDGYLTTNNGLFYSDNDSLSIYINEIARKVIPERLLPFNRNLVYLSKNGHFNAYVLSSGQIILNVGIFENISNEASIASIIAHEFAHYYFNHMIERHMLNKEGKFKFFIENNEKLENKYIVSKEIQADSLAFELLKNSGYNLNAFIEVLELTSFLEQKSLKGNRNLNFYTETTHPSAERRIHAYQKRLLMNKTQNGDYFLQGEERFNSFKRRATLDILQFLLESESYGTCQEIAFKNHIISPTDPVYYYYLLESIRRYCYGKPKLWTEFFITSRYYHDSKAKTQLVIKKELDYPLLKKFEPLLFSMLPQDSNKIIAHFYWRENPPFSTNEEAFNHFYKLSQRMGAKECMLSNALSYTRDTTSRNYYLRKYLAEPNVSFGDYARNILSDSIYSSLPKKKMIVLNEFSTIIRLGKTDIPIYSSCYKSNADIKPILEDLKEEFPDAIIVDINEIKMTDPKLFYIITRMMNYSYKIRITYNEIVHTHILMPEYYETFKNLGVNEIEFLNMLYFEPWIEPRDFDQYSQIVKQNINEVLSNSGRTKYIDILISGLRICDKKSSMFVSYNADIKLNSKISGYDAIFRAQRKEFYNMYRKLKTYDPPSKRIN